MQTSHGSYSVQNKVIYFQYVYIYKRRSLLRIVRSLVRSFVRSFEIKGPLFLFNIYKYELNEI